MPRRILSLAWYIGLLFIFAACSLIPTSTAKPKIGVILPFTGKGVEYSESARDGIEFARRQLAANGREFELIWEDDQFDIKKSVAAYRKLTAIDGVRLIIGPISSGSVLAVAPLADQDQVLVLSPVAGGTAATLGHPYVYRFCPKKDNQIIPLADWLQTKKFARIFAITAQMDSPLDAMRILQARIPNITNRIVTPDQRDFRTELLAARQAGADAIFLNLYLGQFTPALTSYREFGLKIPIFSSIIFDNSTEIEASKNLVDEMVFVSFTLQTPDFVATYKQATGKEPGIATPSAYDAMMVAARVVTAADPKAALDNIGEINGAMGTYYLDSEGDPNIMSPLKVLRHGKVEDFTY